MLSSPWSTETTAITPLDTASAARAAMSLSNVNYAMTKATDGYTLIEH